MAVIVPLLTLCTAELYSEQPTKPLAAGACHLRPVASAESATKPAILQEQSQRIVLSLIAGVLHPRLNLSGLVGLGAGLLW
jgi:hypothetical protein